MQVKILGTAGGLEERTDVFRYWPSSAFQSKGQRRASPRAARLIESGSTPERQLVGRGLEVSGVPELKKIAPRIRVPDAGIGKVLRPH